MTDHDHPPSGPEELDPEAHVAGLATDAPLARGAVIAALGSVVLGFVFVPQLLGLSLAGLSLARREPGGRRMAWVAIAVSLVTTVVWGVGLGLLLKWWASSLA